MTARRHATHIGRHRAADPPTLTARIKILLTRKDTR